MFFRTSVLILSTFLHEMQMRYISIWLYLLSYANCQNEYLSFIITKPYNLTHQSITNHYSFSQVPPFCLKRREEDTECRNKYNNLEQNNSICLLTGIHQTNCYQRAYHTTDSPDSTCYPHTS